MAVAQSDSGFFKKEEILQFISDPDNCEQWQGLGDPEIQRLRIRCADLLDTELWQNAYGILKDGNSDEYWNRFQSPLFEGIKLHYAELCNNEQDQVKCFLLEDEFEKIKKKYEDESETVLKKLFLFLKQEKELINPSKDSDPMMDTSDLPLVVQRINSLEATLQDVQMERKELSALLKKLSGLNETLRIEHDRLQECSFRNGVNRESLKQELLKLSDLRNLKMQEILVKEKATIPHCLQSIKDVTDTLLSMLEEDIDKWKREQQDFYVELSLEKPSTDFIQQHCSKVGKLLSDFLQYELENLQENMQEQVEEIQYVIEYLKEYTNDMHRRYKKFLQKSFLVTDQVHHMIKVEMGAKKRNLDEDESSSGNSGKKKFKCPKIKATVRLVSGDNFDGKEKVKAMFCKEDDIGEITPGYDWKTLENKSFESFPLHPNWAESPFEKKSAVAQFRNLELIKFARNNEKAVAEEKYRLIFRTTIRMVGNRELHLWTMSLPFVVITGASQSCNAYGSLLYQCCAVKDAFAAVPPLCPPSMTWAKVCDMLSRKMSILGGDRRLRDEELKHIGHRIMGTSNDVDPETPIELRRICADKMMDISGGKDGDDKKKSATFWMWFQAVFNLIKNYLKNYWNEGLIEGFLDKDMCQKKLIECRCSTFLLRFSDSSITDGQGQSMCGAISASFVYKDVKNNKQVDHAAPFTAEDLKKKGLARLLRKVVCRETNETMLEWVYPGKQSREEAFKKFDIPDPKKGSRDYTEFEILLVAACKMKTLTLDDEVSPDENAQNHKGSNSKATRPKAVARKRQSKDHSKRIYGKQPKQSPPTPSTNDVPTLDADFLDDSFHGYSLDTKQEVVADAIVCGNIPITVNQVQQDMMTRKPAVNDFTLDQNQVTSSQPPTLPFQQQYQGRNPQTQHPQLSNLLQSQPQIAQNLGLGQPTQKVSNKIQELLKNKINLPSTSFSLSQGNVIYSKDTGLENVKEQDLNTYSNKSPTHVSGGNFGGPAIMEIKPGVDLNNLNQFKNSGSHMFEKSVIDGTDQTIVIEETNEVESGSPVLSNGSPAALPDSTSIDEKDLPEVSRGIPTGIVGIPTSNIPPVYNMAPLQMGNIAVTTAGLSSGITTPSNIVDPQIDMNNMIEHVIRTSPCDGESLADIDMSYFDMSSGSSNYTTSSG